MDLLSVAELSVGVSAGELKLGSRPHPLLLRVTVSGLALSHQRFRSLWRDAPPSKASAHATEWGPAKVLPIGPRTC